MSSLPETATAIAAAVGRGELTGAEIAEAYTAQVERHAEQLGTHLYFDQDDIKWQLRELDARLARGESLLLAGVPVLVKDNICVRGQVTTAGSRMLANWRPLYDATAIARLRAAGAILFGKANLDEFGMGSSNENSAFKPVRNPWNLSRVAGGSSGGSAAAVARGMVPVALGSDTGGSVRQPAALCGVAGLKPTYGRVSRYGLIAYGSSLDQIGPIARHVSDLALLLDCMSGHDHHDGSSLRLAPTQATATLGQYADLHGKTIGIVEELMGEGVEESTRAAINKLVQALRDLGATVGTLSLKNLKYSVPSYYLLASAEASSNLARFDGVRFGLRADTRGQSLREMMTQSRSQGFGREVKQRIMLGTFALSSGYYDAYYAKASKARALLTQDFGEALNKFDFLLSPTYPRTAFPLGEENTDPLALYTADICTLPANLTGLPALSLPCGFDQYGLPIGCQFMARHGGDEALLSLGYLFQKNSNWHTCLPPA